MKELTKLHKRINLLLQIILFAATWIFISRQLFGKTDMTLLWKQMEQTIFQPGKLPMLVIVLLMMFVNWFLEAMKWRFIIGKIEKVTIRQALQAVFTGVSISSFTPNRVGEFFGRVYFLKNSSHVEGILITIIGSAAQLIITILAGIVSLFFFIPRYYPTSLPESLHSIILHPIPVILVILPILVILLILLILPILPRRAGNLLKVFSLFHFLEITILLLLSLARYLVFSAQYFLLLRFFGVPADYFNAMILIAIIYLVMAIIPTIALTELGIRGSVAIYLFSLWATKTNPGAEHVNAGVLASSFLLWLINLGLPAVIGTLFVFRLRFFRKDPR